MNASVLSRDVALDDALASAGNRVAQLAVPSGWWNVLVQSLAMARAVPADGMISAVDVARVRKMAENI